MSILLAPALALSFIAAPAVDEDAEARRRLDEVIAAHDALARGAYEYTLTIEADTPQGPVKQSPGATMIAFEHGDDGSETIVAQAKTPGGRVTLRRLADGGLEAYLVEEGRLLEASPAEAPMLSMTHGLPTNLDSHRLSKMDDSAEAVGVEMVTRDGRELRAIRLEEVRDGEVATRATILVDVESGLAQRMEADSVMPDGMAMSVEMTFDWLATDDDVTDEMLAFDVPDDVVRETFEFDPAALLGGGGFEMPGEEAPGPNVGKPLPDFEFRTGDGEVVTKASLAGKVVVLDFWATWCGPCLMAMPGIERVWQEHRGGDDVVVLGVNVFENGDPAAVMREKGFTYANMLEADALAEALGYNSIPQVVVVDQDGVIRHELSGFSPNHEDALRRHVGDLLAEDDAAEPAAVDPFPTFDLRSTDGTALSLGDLRGKVAVFDFWATWCGPCIAAMPGMQHIHETLGRSDDVAILGMNVFERGDPAALLAEKGLTYTNLLEADAVAEALGIRMIPEVVVIDRNGAIVERITGFVDDHEERVIAAIRTALAR